MSLGDFVIGPRYVLLVHHVAAYETAVVVDDDGPVLAFADGADVTLRNAVGIVRIAKFIE